MIIKMKKIRTNRFYIFYSIHFKKKIFALIILTLLILIGVAAGSFNPFIYGKILDMVNTGQLDTVAKYIMVFFFINLSATLIGLLEGYLGRIISYKASSEARKSLFKKIIKMRVKNLECYPTGELVSRLDSDADNVVEYYINVITNIALITFNLFASVYFVFTISARLSLVAIFYIPASTMVNIFFRKKIRELENKQRVYFDKYMSFKNETFNNIQGIRSYLLENVFENKFAGFIEEQYVLIKKSIWLSNSVRMLSHVISSVFQLVTLYLSAKFIIEGTLTIGSMIAFSTYMGKLYDVVSRILSMNISAQGVIVSMDRMDALQNEPDEQWQYNNAIYVDGHITGIYITSLYFSYKEEMVLNNLSLKCEGSGIYCIVGKNGSGKSTLFKILMGFYEYEGQIMLITNSDLQKYSLTDINLKSLRSKVSYISKDIFILNDTLINNLKIANSTLTEDEIIEICRRIGYDDFVNTLPDKYKTVLLENGSRFSSGQKQKLSAVRAYLSCSDLLLLDEITSDLDGIAESEIMTLVNDLAKTRIVLIISHKITSVMDSKRIFLFDKGYITDEGNHEELMTRSELYRELFRLEDKEIVDDMFDTEAQITKNE